MIGILTQQHALGIILAMLQALHDFYDMKMIWSYEEIVLPEARDQLLSSPEEGELYGFLLGSRRRKI